MLELLRVVINSNLEQFTLYLQLTSELLEPAVIAILAL